jgi:hypothetical protein
MTLNFMEAYRRKCLRGSRAMPSTAQRRRAAPRQLLVSKSRLFLEFSRISNLFLQQNTFAVTNVCNNRKRTPLKASDGKESARGPFSLVLTKASASASGHFLTCDQKMAKIQIFALALALVLALALLRKHPIIIDL